MDQIQMQNEHIELNIDGKTIIKGTTTKVIEIVVEQIAYGWSPEEIYFQHPYLTLGQIYSALAYYWDNQNKFDVEIEARLMNTEKLRDGFTSSPIASKLKLRKVS